MSLNHRQDLIESCMEKCCTEGCCTKESCLAQCYVEIKYANNYVCHTEENSAQAYACMYCNLVYTNESMHENTGNKRGACTICPACNGKPLCRTDSSPPIHNTPYIATLLFAPEMHKVVNLNAELALNNRERPAWAAWQFLMRFFEDWNQGNHPDRIRKKSLRYNSFASSTSSTRLLALHAPRCEATAIKNKKSGYHATVPP